MSTWRSRHYKNDAARLRGWIKLAREELSRTADPSRIEFLREKIVKLQSQIDRLARG